MKKNISIALFLGGVLALVGCFDEKSSVNVEDDFSKINTAIKRFQLANKEDGCPTVEKLVSFGFLTNDKKLPLALSGNADDYLVLNNNGQCIAILNVDKKQ
jgi:hypothetical protein